MEATMVATQSDYKTVKIERDNGIAWLVLNRPEKRNAMSPTLHFEMNDVLDELESDDETKILILTGAGDSWCAGQDLKEYFRGLDANPRERRRTGRAAQGWRWHKLSNFPKPTIAMVNGYCFGGGFTQLIACDLAIAAEDALFSLSEVNWGIFPGGLVSRVLFDALAYRDINWLVLSGEAFDGRKAAEMRLVNRAVPRAELREETVKMARMLMEKNQQVLCSAKEVLRACRTMDYWQAEEYMSAKGIAVRMTDPERGGDEGVKQFIDEK